MCYRYANYEDEREFRRQRKNLRQEIVTSTKEHPFSFYHSNGYAYSKLPVITQDQPNDIQYFNWGLIPFWVKDLKQAGEIKAQTLNARSETVFEKPSFRNSMLTKRCLIPATGFFEWHTEGNDKIPYFITVIGNDSDDERSFCFGGIYSTWTDKATSEAFQTFSIITTDGNEKMNYIHNTKKRMPLILPLDLETTWLNGSLKDSDVMDLMKPYPNELIRARTIKKLLTTKGANANVPEVIEQAVYEGIPELIK